jgi:hypothetical protein
MRKKDDTDASEIAWKKTKREGNNIEDYAQVPSSKRHDGNARAHES